MDQISTFVADSADDGARTPAPPSLDDLRASVASAVLRHSGVFRIEPTLAGWQRGGRGPLTGACGGVVLSVDDRQVRVEVDISTRAGHQVLRTVAQLRAELTGVVGGLGFTCAGVTVNVLRIGADGEES